MFRFAIVLLCKIGTFITFCFFHFQSIIFESNPPDAIIFKSKLIHNEVTFDFCLNKQAICLFDDVFQILTTWSNPPLTNMFSSFDN